jgi:hypothetical protein
MVPSTAILSFSMKPLTSLFLSLLLTTTSTFSADTLNGLPLLFSEDFEKGRDRWEVTDEKSWTHRVVDGNAVFGINRRESDYKPTHRSPFTSRLIKDLSVADFVLTFKVRSTKDTGNHRDCCIIFNHQDPANFYYAHLGAKPDPASGQIMIVQNAPRRPITENTKPVPWTDGWHHVKVVRDSTVKALSKSISMTWKPRSLSATDTTFGKGRIGIGSFDDMNDFDDIRLYAKP